MYVVWFILGLVAAYLLILFAKSKKEKAVLSSSLVIAAIIYIGFSLVWGDKVWFGIELLGVLLYSLFYLLGKKHHFAWVGLGWLLHPIWDIVLHLNGPGGHIVPDWYAVACVSFDFFVAGYIFYKYLIKRN